MTEQMTTYDLARKQERGRSAQLDNALVSQKDTSKGVKDDDVREELLGVQVSKQELGTVGVHTNPQAAHHRHVAMGDPAPQLKPLDVPVEDLGVHLLVNVQDSTLFTDRERVQPVNTRPQVRRQVQHQHRLVRSWLPEDDDTVPSHDKGFHVPHQRGDRLGNESVVVERGTVQNQEGVSFLREQSFR